jgi:hypothetical protein
MRPQLQANHMFTVRVINSSCSLDAQRSLSYCQRKALNSCSIFPIVWRSRRNRAHGLCHSAATSKVEATLEAVSSEICMKLSSATRTHSHVVESTLDSIPNQVLPSAPPPLQLQPLPHHLAIILDGNHRWAARHGLVTRRGHEAGINALRSAVRRCSELGIPMLTVFAFSADNWNRSPAEIVALLSVLEMALCQELPELQNEGARVTFFGDLQRLPKDLQSLIQRCAVPHMLTCMHPCPSKFVVKQSLQGLSFSRGKAAET